MDEPEISRGAAGSVTIGGRGDGAGRIDARGASIRRRACAGYLCWSDRCAISKISSPVARRSTATFHQLGQTDLGGARELHLAHAFALVQEMHVTAKRFQGFGHYWAPLPVQTFVLPSAPQQYLNFLPVPMGQGAFRARTGPVWRIGNCLSTGAVELGAPLPVSASLGSGEKGSACAGG